VPFEQRSQVAGLDRQRLVQRYQLFIVAHEPTQSSGEVDPQRSIGRIAFDSLREHLTGTLEVARQQKALPDLVEDQRMLRRFQLRLLQEPRCLIGTTAGTRLVRPIDQRMDPLIVRRCRIHLVACSLLGPPIDSAI
jgi:hypothetical protein